MAQFFLSFFPPFLYFFLLFLFLFLSVIIFSFFSSPFTRHFSSSFSRAHVPPQLLLFICHLSSVICHCIPSVIKHLSFVICHHDSRPFTSQPLQSYSLHLPFLIVIIKPQNPTTFFFQIAISYLCLKSLPLLYLFQPFQNLLLSFPILYSYFS